MKKGYTLIELIIVINIIIVLSFLGGVISNSVKKQIEYLEIKTSLYEISNSLSYLKHYCRNNNVNGAIKVDKNNSEIVLYNTTNSNEVLKVIRLPKSVSFLGEMRLSVTITGNIQSETIRIKDSEGNIYKITISTGIDTINIYEGE